jgi:hypothetical protein
LGMLCIIPSITHRIASLAHFGQVAAPDHAPKFLAKTRDWRHGDKYYVVITNFSSSWGCVATIVDSD